MPWWILLILFVCSAGTMFLLKRLGTKKHYKLILDLTNSDVWSTQLKLAQEYERKSKLPKISLLWIGVLLWTIAALKGAGFEQSNIFKIFMGVMGVSIFVIVPLTYIKARCPKCNELQPIPTYKIGGFALGNNLGFSPFAWRCSECECYLSTKLLYEDLEKQQKQQIDETFPLD